MAVNLFTADLLEIQSQVHQFAQMPLKDISKAKLASISGHLRDLSKQLPKIPPPQTNDEMKASFEMQELFKALVLQVNRLLKELIDARRATIQGGETEVVAPERVLKKPQLLIGFLRKQGEKGLVKNWKRRYFRQQQNRLYYYVSEELNDSPLGFIPLDEVSNVIKRKDFTFDVCVPGRVYHLQAKDELQWNEWVIKTEEWIEFYKQQTIDRQKVAAANSPDERKKWEESVKILSSEMENHEAILEILDKQIETLQTRRTELLAENEQNREKVKQQLLVDISAYDNQIAELYNQLRVKEEQLVAEEKRSDSILMTLARDSSKLVLLEAEHENLSTQVQTLQNDLQAHTASIQYLEKAIEAEMDKQKKTHTVQNKQFQQLTQQLNERRTANHKLQAQNSALHSEITLATNQHAATNLEKLETIKSTQFYITQYEKQYHDLLELMATSQGATKEMALEYEFLKERYFNSLLLQMKLQIQSTGTEPPSINFDELYQRYEHTPFTEWPSIFQTEVFSPSATPKKARREPLAAPPKGHKNSF